MQQEGSRSKPSLSLAHQSGVWLSSTMGGDDTGHHSARSQARSEVGTVRSAPGAMLSPATVPGFALPAPEG